MTRRMVPAEWMDGPAAWDDVDPCVAHNSFAHLETWAESNCLLMFLASAPMLRVGGVKVLDFADIFAPSMVFGQ